MKTKEMKGITLVALVVTIVVLLILAGVSINTVLGDNGIITKAKEVAETTRQASAEEDMNRLVLEYELAQSDETFEDFLKEKVNEGRINGTTDNGDGTITISKKVDGKDYTITVKKPSASTPSSTPSIKISAIKVVSDSTGAGTSLGEESTKKGTTLYIMIESSITGGTTTVSPKVPYAVTANGIYKFTVTGTVNGTAYTKEVSVTVNQFKNGVNLEDLKIGDYVNYTYDTASNYVLTSATSGSSSNPTDGIPQTSGLKWRILNIDEAKGTVDLISATPTSNTVGFGGILGYNNGPYLMNAICEAQYSNKTLGVKARNISLLDMEKQLTTAGIAARNGYNGSTVQYGKTKTYTNNYSYYPLLYDGQKGAGVNVTEANASTITQPDTTKGNDPYSESVETTSPLTDKTSKQADDKVLTVTQTYYYIPINEANYGEAYKVLNNSTTYWVSGRFVNTRSSCAYFGLRFANTNMNGYYMFHSGSSNNSNIGRLRPVVSLSSSHLTGEKTNDAWNLSK